MIAGACEFDLVVIGSGAAGLAAALAGREAGLDVVVLERAELVGGTTAFSAGALWLPANVRMRESGIHDGPEDACGHLRNLTAGSVADEVMNAYLETAARAIGFLVRTTPLRMAACTKYADDYPERPGDKPIARRRTANRGTLRRQPRGRRSARRYFSPGAGGTIGPAVVFGIRAGRRAAALRAAQRRSASDHSDLRFSENAFVP